MNYSSKILIINDDVESGNAYLGFFESRGYNCKIYDIHSALTDKGILKFDLAIVDLTNYSKKVFQLLKKLGSKKVVPKDRIYVVYAPPIRKSCSDIVKNFKMLPKPMTLEHIERNILAPAQVFSPRVEYDEPLIDAVKSCLAEFLGHYLGEETVMEFKASIKKDHKLDSYASSYLPFTGDEVYGTMLLNLEKPTLHKVVAEMYGDSEMELSDEELFESIGELINQVGGMAMDVLGKAGYTFWIGLPNSFISNNRYFYHSGINQVLSIEFHPKDKKPSFFNKTVNSLEICLNRSRSSKEKAS